MPIKLVRTAGTGNILPIKSLSAGKTGTKLPIMHSQRAGGFRGRCCAWEAGAACDSAFGL